MATENVNLRRFEFDGLLQDVHKREKGSKSCKDPHTLFSVITRPITNEEMDAIVYGGVYGFKVKLIIEVVQENKTPLSSADKKEVSA